MNQALQLDRIGELRVGKWVVALYNFIVSQSPNPRDFGHETLDLDFGLTKMLQVLQLHAHWGDKSGYGSEHTVDGKSFDAELHIVHFNTKYVFPGEALDKEDGLAVLGIFITVGDHDHPEFEKICKRFTDIENAKEIVQLEDDLNINNLIPGNQTFFTYPGSLTTPPLYESVTWIVFKQEIKISQRQV